jgi:hypothetical protein
MPKDHGPYSVGNDLGRTPKRRAANTEQGRKTYLGLVWRAIQVSGCQSNRFAGCPALASLSKVEDEQKNRLFTVTFADAVEIKHRH